VLSLKDDLVLDPDLVTSVAQALASDPQTRFERISIGARNGFITLNGHVDSPELREVAVGIAASVPQVRGVINYIQAPNTVADPKEPLVWQPLIGKEVCATDMQLGYVERVIINPHTRRVTAFVVHGTFPDPQAKDDYRFPGEDPQPERSVEIPIGLIRYTTDSSVLLEVSGAGAAGCRTFDPAGYMDPPAEWRPPYPYRWEQVLFARQRLEEL
jgi:hypothetical protein